MPGTSTLSLGATPGPLRTITAKSAALVLAPGTATHRGEATALAFDGWSGQYIETWYDFSSVELVYEMYGPEQARITAPAAMAYWHHQRCMPGGRGVYLQFDPRGVGLPIWTGRLTNPQPSGGSLDCSAQIVGPREWMDDYHTALGNPSLAPASKVMRDVLETAGVNPPVRFDYERAHRGPAIKADLAGKSVWETIDGLVRERGEWAVMVAQEGTPEYRLEWRHALGGDNLTGLVTLEHGVNSEWDAVPDIEGKIDELLVVGQSWNLGNRNYGARARISPARAFGRRAALEAVVSSAALSNLTGQTQTEVSLTQTSRDAAQIAIESRLRRLANSALPCRIEITDTGLWPHLRPGVIVSGRWDDPHGLFGRCQVRVETMTVDLVAETMQLSAWLWDQED